MHDQKQTYKLKKNQSGMRMRKGKNSWKSAWTGEGGEADEQGEGVGG